MSVATASGRSVTTVMLCADSAARYRDNPSSAILLMPWLSPAQSVNGLIVGHVMDGSRKPIKGAEIELIEEGTNRLTLRSKVLPNTSSFDSWMSLRG